MLMKLYPINVTKLGISLLPTMLRSASVVEFIRISLFPLHFIQNAFFNQRDNNIYLLVHNGQVYKLRAVLNDAFPGISKSFLIDDYIYSGKWLYAYDEELIYKQLMVPESPVALILWDEETMSKYADFKVSIPIELQSDDNLNKIRALVNKYKLVSKKAVYEYD